MEDIQQYNFIVKSNIHDYEVYFIDNVKLALENELKDGDFIIIDKNAKALYPEWFCCGVILKYGHFLQFHSV